MPKKNPWTYKKRKPKRKKVVKVVAEPETPEAPPHSLIPSENLLPQVSTDKPIIKAEPENVLSPKKPATRMCSTALLPAFGLIQAQIINNKPSSKVKEELSDDHIDTENNSSLVKVEVEVNGKDDPKNETEVELKKSECKVIENEIEVELKSECEVIENEIEVELKKGECKVIENESLVVKEETSRSNQSNQENQEVIKNTNQNEVKEKAVLNENDECEIIAAVKPVKRLKKNMLPDCNEDEDVVYLGESVIEIEPLGNLQTVETEVKTEEKELQLGSISPESPVRDSPFISHEVLLQTLSDYINSRFTARYDSDTDVIEVEPMDTSDTTDPVPTCSSGPQCTLGEEQCLKEELMQCDTTPSSPVKNIQESHNPMLTPEEVQFAFLQKETACNNLNSIKEKFDYSSRLEKDAIYCTDIVSRIEVTEANQIGSIQEFDSELQAFSDLKISENLFTLDELCLCTELLNSISFHLHSNFASKGELTKSLSTSIQELISSYNHKFVVHNTQDLAHSFSPINNNIGSQAENHPQIDSCGLTNVSTDINKCTPLEINRIDITQLKNILESTKKETKIDSTSRKRIYSEFEYSCSESPSRVDPSNAQYFSKTNYVSPSESVTSTKHSEPRILPKNNSECYPEINSNTNPLDPRKSNLISYPQYEQPRVEEPLYPSHVPKKPRSEKYFPNKTSEEDVNNFLNTIPKLAATYPYLENSNPEQINNSPNQNVNYKPPKSKKIDIKEYMSRRRSSSIEGSPKLNLPKSIASDKGNSNPTFSSSIEGSPRLNPLNYLKSVATDKVNSNPNFQTSNVKDPRFNRLNYPKNVTVDKSNSNTFFQMSNVKDPRLNNSSILISGLVRQPPSNSPQTNNQHVFNQNMIPRNFTIRPSTPPVPPILPVPAPVPPILPVPAPVPPILPMPAPIPPILPVPAPVPPPEINFPFVNLVPPSLIQDIGINYIQSSCLYLIVLGWREEWFSEYENNCKMNSPLLLPPILNYSNSLSQIRNTYRDEREHYNTYLKLLLVECWYKLYTSWKRQANKEYVGKIRTQETNNEFVKYIIEYFVPTSEKVNMPDESSILQLRFKSKSNRTFQVLGYVTSTANRKFDALYDQNNDAFKMLKTSGNNILKYRINIYTVYKSDDIDITKMVTHKKLVNIRRFLQQNDSLNNLRKSSLCPAILSPITSEHKLSLSIADSSGDVSAAVDQLCGSVLRSKPLLALVNSSLSLDKRISVISEVVSKIHLKKPDSKVLIFSKSEKNLSDMKEALKNLKVVFMIKDRIPETPSNIPKRQAQFKMLRESDVITVSMLGCFETEFLKDLHISCCILDDAHDCTEPESVIPLSCDKITKFILFGVKDAPCEASPVTSSYDFNRSLFNRASL